MEFKSKTGGEHVWWFSLYNIIKIIIYYIVTYVVAKLDGRIYLRLGLATVILHGRQSCHFRRTVVTLWCRKIYRFVSFIGRAGIARFRRFGVICDFRGLDGRLKRQLCNRRKTSRRRRWFCRSYWNIISNDIIIMQLEWTGQQIIVCQKIIMRVAYCTVKLTYYQ